VTDALTEEVGRLKRAIDTNDLEAVVAMMTRNPQLHAAPLWYGKDGPLTWVAECRVPWESPKPVRLEMARWMIANGSDVHQGGDGPLGRAALNDYRIPMMELLVAHGADVNAVWRGHFPLIFSPCESLAPGAFAGCSSTAPTRIAPIRHTVSATARSTTRVKLPGHTTSGPRNSSPPRRSNTRRFFQATRRTRRRSGCCASGSTELVHVEIAADDEMSGVS